MGREGDDGEPDPALLGLQGADAPRGLEAVHLRHAAVHQDQVDAAATCDLQRVAAVDGHLRLHAEPSQRLNGDLAVDRAVVRHQHPPALEARGRVRAGAALAAQRPQGLGKSCRTRPSNNTTAR